MVSNEAAFSIDLVDAFKQNNPDVFRIASKSPDKRDIDEKETFSSFINDVQDQVS